MSLVHIYWIHGNHRRIVPHHFRTSAHWLAAAALPKPKKKYRRRNLLAVGNSPSAPLTPAQFEARRRLCLHQLKSAKNCAL